jgi:hypothetical protein
MTYYFGVKRGRKNAIVKPTDARQIATAFRRQYDTTHCAAAHPG